MLKPGLHFLEIGHEQGCPGRYTNGGGCNCDPSITLHTDHERFMHNEIQNRAARREAQREAERAMRRARKGAR